MIARENFQQRDEIVAIAKIFEKVLNTTSNLQINQFKSLIRLY